MRTSRIALLTLASVLIMVSCKPIEVNEVTFINHKLQFEINVEKHSATFKDAGLMQVKSGVNLLYLAPNVEVEAFVVGGIDVEFKTLDSMSLSNLKQELSVKIQALDPPMNALWVVFDQKTPGERTFSIKYSGIFDTDVSDAKFSNQNVGREITGVIIEKGAYFSPGSYYYPQGQDGLMGFELIATIPANWESIADGDSTTQSVNGETKVQGWKNPYQSDGLMFMAAPYKTKHVKSGDVDVYCYFFEEDTSLFETYLPATAEYVKMYSDMIGPYPYERFTVAENFFPTGYGMPAWTLLGQQVIRLPFIVMTSLGHEVLHNWWGNSIYVDYEKGNWCEGLTVYGADYYYKLKRSPASARDYRKDILKAYKNYVTPENEFPVREFIARHNAESRTIGYNKTMMIFHMIENRIGTEAFFQAWRDVYASHKGEKVTWEQWITAYEVSSGENLDFVIPEWVDRVGAARISVDLLESENEKGQTRLKFQVNQTENEVYTLKIPLKFIGIENQNTTIEVSEASTTVELTLDGEVTAFELDPDYQVFRHLYPEEMEPTVAAAMGSPNQHFVYTSESDKLHLKVFGDNLTESNITTETEAFTDPAGNYAIITLNPKELPVGLAQQVQIKKSSIMINGSEYPRAGHTFVLSGEAKNTSKVLVVLSDDQDSLPRLGELVPHYGKYSYLVFKGSRNIAKGQWPALTSPLRIEL